MTQLLLKLFIKQTDPQDPAYRSACGKLAGLVGIICNILLFLGKLLAGLLSELAVTSGAAQHADLITTGDIMPFIPGLALTNAIRDMFQGDTVTGLTRLSEAILMSIIVVLGALIGAMLH